MINSDNFLIKGSDNREMLADISLPENRSAKDMVIFIHGFKGFKDWGTHNLVAKYFAEHNLAFLKFNFSHNGTTIKDPLNFTDLDSFGKNTFTKEIDDLNSVLDFVLSNKRFTAPENIYLIGHSRGGGIGILKAAADVRIKKLVTWASVSHFKTLIMHNDNNEWRKQGVVYIENARTKQQMPLFSTLLDDITDNASVLDIPAAAAKIRIPWLIIHRSSDTSVTVSHAEILHQTGNSELLIVKNANHVFGATHPSRNDELPDALRYVCDETVRFLRS